MTPYDPRVSARHALQRATESVNPSQHPADVVALGHAHAIVYLADALHRWVDLFEQRPVEPKRGGD